MSTTFHSEYHPIKRVFLKPPQNAFRSQQMLDEQWRDLNYLSLPNFENSLKEYNSFLETLKTKDAEFLFFENDERTSIDSIYCRDASIATNFGMIICNMGKSGRINEPQAQEKNYLSQNIQILGKIESPGTLEGGDVAWLDESTLAVGHTYRTNEAGIDQLKKLLNPKGVDVIVAELPHYKGKQDVFHLMSILSPVDKDLAIVYSPLMPIKFRNELISRGIQLIEVPEEEFESMGCNVLAISPRHCIMVEGNPLTKKQLEEAGCKVVTYKGSEISVKGGGGPTCLTRPLERWL